MKAVTAMFTIEEIDPKEYRKKTRNATLIIMAMFIVIGMITASLTVHYLAPYNDNRIVLNFMGAFIGLIITFMIVKTFFINKPWMAEAMYGWKLKRNLMKIYNVLEALKTKVAEGNTEAMKVMRFYHLGQEQMNHLENNSHAQIELLAEKNLHEQKMLSLGLEINQLSFDPQQIADYQTNN